MKKFIIFVRVEDKNHFSNKYHTYIFIIVWEIILWKNLSSLWKLKIKTIFLINIIHFYYSLRIQDENHFSYRISCINPYYRVKNNLHAISYLMLWQQYCQPLDLSHSIKYPYGMSNIVSHIIAWILKIRTTFSHKMFCTQL